MRSASVRALLVAAAVLCLASCSTERHVTKPVVPPSAPAPDSPVNAIRLFEWGWNHRDLGAFRDVLAGDFVFVFAPGDSAGNAFRDDPIGRDELLVCLERLFTGGGSAPPATSIALNLDPTLRALPDSRPGRNPKWHQEIVTSVDLTIKTAGDQEYRILGNARFFVVRGDSAEIPADLAARGVGPDSTRWYIGSWHDETFAGGGALLWALPAMPQPGHQFTWGTLLAIYH